MIFREKQSFSDVQQTFCSVSEMCDGPLKNGVPVFKLPIQVLQKMILKSSGNAIPSIQIGMFLNQQNGNIPSDRPTAREVP